MIWMKMRMMKYNKYTIYNIQYMTSVLTIYPLNEKNN